MNKYQEALNKIKIMGDKDLFNEFHIKWADTLQELVDKYNAIQDVYFKNVPMESADLNARKLQELYNLVNEVIEENQKLKDKATPMKPIIRGLSGAIHTYVHTCPVCGKELIVTNNETVIYKTKTNYCDECGQKLDWSGETYNE